jgi:Fur family ferric uptake transcriptional regulator
MLSLKLVAKLKSVGLKITQSRLKILQVLEQEQQHHLNAEAVYAILSREKAEVGLATVYRVLTQFEEVELVKRHDFAEGHAVFELNQGSHHDHLVCTKCGAVQEFVDERIETFQREIASEHHFKMTDHVLNIYGLCQACQA